MVVESCGEYAEIKVWVKNYIVTIGGSKITVNVPLILKVREIFFFRGIFEGFFGGAVTFLTPKLSSPAAVPLMSVF